MHSPQFLAENFDYAAEQLARRGYELDPGVVTHYSELNEAVKRLDDLRAEKNRTAKDVAAISRGLIEGDRAALIDRGKIINTEIKGAEDKERKQRAELLDFVLGVPNIPAPHTPNGLTEADNVVTAVVGEPRKFDFAPKDHVTLGEDLGVIDIPAGTKLAGPRFNVLHGRGAALQRALVNFMLQKAAAGGFEETTLPYLVNSSIMQGTGQLPKFADDMYPTADDLWLIPTAEVPLTNLEAGTIINPDRLPIRRTAYTECFRREAGSAGRDTRGILRAHQFPKVELVSITHPDASWDELERMTSQASSVLEDLELPYRKVSLAAGDISFAAQWTTDLEVWLPGQDTYREISSISNTGDFQARRMNLRMRNPEGSGTILPHTLNGSALAVGRTLLAVMENYQQEDGSIRVPTALHNITGFDKIESNR